MSETITAEQIEIAEQYADGQPAFVISHLPLPTEMDDVVRSISRGWEYFDAGYEIIDMYMTTVINWPAEDYEALIDRASEHTVLVLMPDPNNEYCDKFEVIGHLLFHPIEDEMKKPCRYSIVRHLEIHSYLNRRRSNG